MEQLSTVINNNDRSMKTCILYEALKKKPIFSSYRHFCKLVGQDAMEYPDFEFWYYRFLHKQHDFDYDRSADPTPKTIMEMPVSLMYKITENLDQVERTYLRSMNKPLKDMVDSRPPSFDVIDITAYDKYLGWEFDDKFFSCEQKDYGCLLKIPNFPPIKSDEFYLKKGMEYLSPVLKMPNIQVNHLSLHIMTENEHFNDLLPVPFHAKSVSITAFNINKSLELLSAMNPGELESIKITTGTVTRENLSKLCETEQFKQAIHVQTSMSLNEDRLLRFSHLRTFKCAIDRFGPMDFQRIRDIISTFEQFESCELGNPRILIYFDIRTVAESLGAENPMRSWNLR